MRKERNKTRSEVLRNGGSKIRGRLQFMIWKPKRAVQAIKQAAFGCSSSPYSFGWPASRLLWFVVTSKHSLWKLLKAAWHISSQAYKVMFLIVLLNFSRFCFCLFTFLIHLDRTVLEQEYAFSWIVLSICHRTCNEHGWNPLSRSKLKLIFLLKDWGWRQGRGVTIEMCFSSLEITLFLFHLL